MGKDTVVCCCSADFLPDPTFIVTAHVMAATCSCLSTTQKNAEKVQKTKTNEKDERREACGKSEKLKRELKE